MNTSLRHQIQSEVPGNTPTSGAVLADKTCQSLRLARYFGTPELIDFWCNVAKISLRPVHAEIKRQVNEVSCILKSFP